MSKDFVLRAISDKNKRDKQNWIRPKNLDICFCLSFGCIAQNYFLEGKPDTSLCFHPILRFSFHFFSFHVLTRNTEFTVVDITYCFTCFTFNFTETP